LPGRHAKPPLVPLKTKLTGGIVAGAALAATVAASAAAGVSQEPRTGSDRPVASASDAHNKDRDGVQHMAVAAEKATKKKGEAAPAKKAAKKANGKVNKPARASTAARKINAAQVIRLAKSEIGTSEDNSGETKFNKWFMDDRRAEQTVKRDGGDLAGYKDAAWCSMFISWIGSRLGISDQMGFDAWTPEHANWFKNHGRWGSRPRPGAVTFFSWSGGKDVYDIDHVGLTIKDNGDGTIRTIEGNTKNTVAIRKRDKSDVVGYGYPDYAK
jgi:hypothetical protein